MKTGTLFHAAIHRMLIPLGLLFACGVCTAEDLIFNTQDFAPFTYLDDINRKDNAVAGPAVDVIKAVCKEMGQPYKIQLLPWTRAQEEVKDGQAHALFLIGWNPERAAWLNPSLPIVVTEYGFFVHVNNPLVFKDVSQLKDYSVAVYGPSNTATSLEKIKGKVPGMTIDMTPDDDSAFKKLDIERVKAVFSNKDVGFANLKRLGLKNVRYAGMQSQLKYFIGFSQAHVPKPTVDKFNEIYRKLYLPYSPVSQIRSNSSI